MKKNFKRKKVILLVILGTLLTGDAGLTVFSIYLASSGVTPQQTLAEQSALVKLLRADVKRALEIQQAVPKTKMDCASFEDSLPPAGTGYSVISGEFQDLGQKSGLQIASLSFRPKEGTARGIQEVSLDASVTGDYKGVVRFLNGLQHSKNHYIVDDLTLANDRGESKDQLGIRINLHVRSYFRAAV